MGTQESEKRRTYGMTLNPDLVDWLRTDAKVSNLSSWVNEQMRDYKLKITGVLRCPCGVESTRAGWARWQGRCPNCKHDHATEDKRERVSL